MMIPLADKIRVSDLNIIRVDDPGVPAMQSMVENPRHVAQMHNSENQRFLWVEVFRYNGAESHTKRTI